MCYTASLVLSHLCCAVPCFVFHLAGISHISSRPPPCLMLLKKASTMHQLKRDLSFNPPFQLVSKMRAFFFSVLCQALLDFARFARLLQLSLAFFLVLWIFACYFLQSVRGNSPSFSFAFQVSNRSFAVKCNVNLPSFFSTNSKN